MKNDTQIKPASDNSENIEKVSIHTSTDEQVKQVSQDSKLFAETILDSSDKSTRSEVHQLKTSSGNTTFKMEKTPQMGVEHLEKVAPVAVASATVHRNPSQNWSVEKTILINDDENSLASFVRLDTKERFILDTFPFNIGRAQDCQLRLEDMSLSRQHARIQKTESGLSIEDLDSANGIKVNDISIDQVLLMEGDVITVGHIKLRFDLKNISSSVQKTEKISDEFLERINLTHPNWKKVTAGVIGTILAGIFYYKSQVDDRIIVSESPTTSNASQPEQTKASEPAVPAEVVADKATITAPASTILQASNDIAQSTKKTETKLVYPAAVDVATAAAITTSTTTTEETSAVEKQEQTDNQKQAKKEAEQHPSESKLINSNNELSPSKTLTNTSAKPAVTAPSISQEKTKYQLDEDEFESAVKRHSQPEFTDKSKSISASLLETRPQKTKSAQHLSITNARKLYQQGKVKKAINMLDKLSTNSRLSDNLQSKASQLHTKMVSLQNYYQQGLQAYKNNNKNQAWDAWTTFILAEKKIKLPATSHYAENIKLRILAESLNPDRSVKQRKIKKPSQAVRQQAPQRSIDNQANRSMKVALETSVRDLYRDGYRLEHSNLSKAIERWHNVVKLATPNSEYYTKAKAKLRFYEEMNR